jgi:hypothetical protein
VVFLGTCLDDQKIFERKNKLKALKLFGLRKIKLKGVCVRFLLHINLDETQKINFCTRLVEIILLLLPSWYCSTLLNSCLNE